MGRGKEKRAGTTAEGARQGPNGGKEGGCAEGGGSREGKRRRRRGMAEGGSVALEAAGREEGSEPEERGLGG